MMNHKLIVGRPSTEYVNKIIYTERYGYVYKLVNSEIKEKQAYI